MYRESLSREEHHLTTRLEAFGDIVFGFSLSQSALQLTIPQHAADLGANPTRYALYGVTFGILVAYWLRFHRIVSIGYRPERPDLSLLFAFLASISLLPYAMISFARLQSGGDLDQRSGFALYAIIVLLISATGFALEWRGLRRAYAILDEARRTRIWRAIVRSGFSCVALAAGIAIDVTWGMWWAFTPFVLAPLNRLTPLARGPAPARLFDAGTSRPSGVS
jgi:uncharacterized membrane protein